MIERLPRVVIIGGGAAGFFCAANLDHSRYHIQILEQNAEVLQKVKISGGGRCNLTHACFDPHELVQFYPRGHKELLSVFSKFQPADTMAWFDAEGVPLKIEADQRVFPESNSSQTIIDTLCRKVENQVEVLTKITVKDITPRENDGYLITTNQNDIEADLIIFTTGSSPKAFRLLERLGHRLIPPVPSLFTFNIKDALLEGLSGTSFPYAEVKITLSKAEESGALLITHWGLSGPAILKLSAWQARHLADLNYQFDLEVNFLGTTVEDAFQNLKDFKTEHAHKKLYQIKPFEITSRFWVRILETVSINPEERWAQLSKAQLLLIAETLCKKRFKVNGKSTFKEEFVTAGGVSLKEIDFKTMASKRLPNFYIAGEVLDIDAVTGGFNFQACWSEAWLIAQHLNQTTHHQP